LRVQKFFLYFAIVTFSHIARRCLYD